mmetsp:Transcript_27726/g.39165  ORF Transcript_27726/g.39165 Transcript_27726/m.39165 type:complete len:187 (+) Transcript_27726:187-747(+)|eukprot:CAMPEP_0202444562 /NCGR_PEP_ID=MMETSP1360-20130828/3592_1 /ASSEMBLY_ACC=CAM_ASM_000848 /TAXON_ID=515479 /ORGANISM="Licmophora paradoxa, Strain CCMP2313" /LENGTH=186 /DNA_ID=CAMNT_0049060581 /DNA_START=543 /DNA_END=1103 /DNA_ORIENTATION=-
MSEESKTPDADYVHMGDNGITPGGGKKIPGLDDPNLSQEDRDMRLALALQQQENAAAYDQHMKKHKASVAAHTNRTTRSNVHTRLAAVRDKDHGMLSVPASYTTDNAYIAGEDYKAPASVPPKDALPQEIADHNMAMELQKVEQVGAGVAQATEKILKEEMEDQSAQKHRTERSNFHINQKGVRKP